MMHNKIGARIDELKAIIRLEEYDHVIVDLVQKIYSSGCAVMTWPARVSKHSSSVGDCTICLGIHPERERRHVLWDLFHEFGHHLDPNKLKKEDENNEVERQRRERAAWKLAEEAFASYPALQKEQQSFVAYRTLCLNSYYNTNGKASF